MKILIVDDDFTSRLVLQESLKGLGLAHIAVNGREAVQAVRDALDANQPYDLICLDILMPEMDGHEALRAIRSLEEARGIGPGSRASVIITSSVADVTSITAAREEQCDYYLVKPINRLHLRDALRRLHLVA